MLVSRKTLASLPGKADSQSKSRCIGHNSHEHFYLQICKTPSCHCRESRTDLDTTMTHEATY